MPTGIELRPIYYAQQLNGVLGRIIRVLKDFQPQSLKQLKSKSLCYHRDGVIDICDSPCENSLNDWCLMAFYEYVESGDGTVFNLGLKFEKVLEFANSLVSQSPFDEEIVDRFYVTPEWLKAHPGNFNAITDPLVESKEQSDFWWTEYAKVRREVSELCYQIGSEFNWTLRFKGLLKDKILEVVFDLRDYLPSRLHSFKKDCRRTFRDLCDNGGINALNESNKRICRLSEPHLRRFFADKADLFTENIIEDLLLYIVAINIVFDYWTY